VCAAITPIENRIEVLILQHPQEQDRLLGTARLTVHHLRRASFRIGLSWPSLDKALGRPVDPRRWAVVHLGSAEVEAFAPGRDLAVLDRHGTALPEPEQAAALAALDGVVLLDGTWSQAKTLWWRNAWVLKGPRLAIRPPQPSLYGKLRREPRRESLSTLEATALVLSCLEQRPEIEKTMLSSFRRMLQVYRDAQGAEAAGAGRRSP
jgi:DTW domain-containing protein YfiP